MLQHRASKEQTQFSEFIRQAVIRKLKSSMNMNQRAYFQQLQSGFYGIANHGLEACRRDVWMAVARRLHISYGGTRSGEE